MVKVLVDIVRAAKVPIAETSGAGLLVIGFGLWLGVSAALITGGVALLAKSFEWDVRGAPK